MDSNANEPGVGEKEVNPNTNCLYGTRCPKCGSYGPFEILISMLVLLYDDGSDDAEDGTINYGDNSPTKCYACGYKGKFGDFGVN